jgi:hypothetical protein
MTATTKPTAQQLAEWKAANYPYKLIAAPIAERMLGI